VVGEDEEPELVRWSDVKYSFEAQGSSGTIDLPGGGELDATPGRMAVRIEGHQETDVHQRVVMERQPREGRITAEVGIGALVQPVGGQEVGFEVFDEETAPDIGPPGAAVGKGRIIQIIEGLLGGGGGGG
jgi:hypothetical protein